MRERFLSENIVKFCLDKFCFICGSPVAVYANGWYYDGVMNYSAYCIESFDKDIDELNFDHKFHYKLYTPGRGYDFTKKVGIESEILQFKNNNKYFEIERIRWTNPDQKVYEITIAPILKNGTVDVDNEIYFFNKDIPLDIESFNLDKITKICRMIQLLG